MIHAQLGSSTRLAPAFLGALLAAACTSQPSGGQPAAGASSVQQAAFSNGSFETGDLTGWTVTPYLGAALAVAPPTTRAQLNLSDGGSAMTYSRPAGDSGIPWGLTAAASLRFPRFGSRAAVVNEGGLNKNANSLKQTMTVDVSDVDPADGKVHLRFVLAPVLENPNHTEVQQPYFWVTLRNLTRGTELFHTFNFASQPGVPWKTADDTLGNPAQYTDWQAFDVAPGNVALQVGDSVELEIIAAGCSKGAHFGEIYVDAFGSIIPGISVAASGPGQANAGTNITYTFVISNGGSTTASGVITTEHLPANTTFVSYSAPGMSCTAPDAGTAGGTNDAGVPLSAVACTLSSLNPAATASFTVTVRVANGATGKISNGDYLVEATGIAPLIGPLVETTITSGATYADLSVTKSDGVAAAAWGQALTYTIDVANAGPSAVTGATVVDAIPAVLTGAQWTCAGIDGGVCTASGTGSLNTTVNLPVGAHAVYTVNATVDAGSGNGTVSNTVTVATPSGVVDPNTVDNAAIDTDSLGSLYALTITKAGVGNGTVVSSPAAISCGATCTAQFLSGSSVSLTATAQTGHTFTGWSGACTGTTNPCVLTISGATAVTATFTAPSFAVGTSVTGGNGTFTCPTPVAEGSPAVCTAAPSTGYHLATLTDNSADVFSSVSSNQYTIASVTQAHTLVATFAINSYALSTSVTGGNGTLSCPATVNHGSPATCTATPSAGYHLATITDDSADVFSAVSSDQYSLASVTAAHTLVATFTLNAYALSTSVPGGNGTLSCPATVNHGSPATCTATPAAGYHLAALTDDGTDVFSAVSSNQYSLANVTAAHTLVATFAINAYALSTSVTGSNGTLSCPATANHGSPATCTATPAAGYHLATLTDDGANVLGSVLSNEYTIASVTAAHGLVASFALNSYGLSTSVPAGNGALSCPATVNHGSPATCTATPSTGYHLSALTDDGADVFGSVFSGQYALTSVTSAHTLVATFAIDTYALSTSVPGGNGTLSCPATVDHGSPATCTATPSAGYHLTALTDNGADVLSAVSSNQYALTSVTAAHTLVAAFSHTTHTVTANGSGVGGTVSCPSPVNEGAVATCTIVASAGYVLAALTDDGTDVLSQVSGGDYSLGAVLTDHVVSATFLKDRGTACGAQGECATGHCIDGVCCNTACGGGSSDCQACSVTAGAAANGTCGPSTGNTCNDGDLCTQTDTCQVGTCTGTTPVTCSAADACHVAGTCNPATGVCSNPAANDGTGCSDGDACTTGDVCTGGSCGGAPVVCTALDACHLAGSCQASTGQCTTPEAPDQTVCNSDAGVCISGGCHPAAGQACTDDTGCASGHCVDGLCCNTACSGQCQACDVAGNEGTCVAVTGAPHGTRTACASDNSACAGACDGTLTTGCTYPGASTACRAASCTGTQATLAEVCDGTGLCPATQTQDCGTYACGATTCQGNCSADSDCASGNWCSAGVCIAKLTEGVSCGGGNQCASAQCIDGVCCNVACDGACEACDVTGHLGTCTPIVGAPRGTRTACASDNSACAGACDGTLRAACTYPDSAVRCRDASCASGTATLPAFCDGAGACPTLSTQNCGQFVCGPTQCLGDCTTDSNCSAGNWCSAGVCVAKQPAGDACTTNAQCGSGFCADGVCCASACDGQCEACNSVGHAGECTVTLGAPQGNRQACLGDGTNCAGACDGTLRTACTYPAAETSCRQASCTSGTATLAASCDGAGACPSVATQACGAFQCGLTACLGNCTVDTECAQGQWCSAGVCVADKTPGATCAGDHECGTGLCVDGVCCATACGGQCESCAEAGHEGTCVPVQGAPRGARAACAGDGSACSGSCDGTTRDACSFPGTSVDCRAGSCSAGVAVASADCDGLGHCPALSTQVCNEYVCGPTACEASCLDTSACVDGFTCAQGTCRPSDVVAAEAEAARLARLQEFGVSGTGCGCQSSGSPAAWGVVLLGLFFLARRRRTAIAAAVAAAAVVTLAPSQALAQAPSLSNSFSVQRFQPESGALDVLGVESARTPGHLRWSVVLYGNYAQTPLRLFNKSGTGEAVALVRNQTGLDLGASLGLGDRYELSVVVPVTVYQSAGATSGLDPALDQPLTPMGFADARVTPKMRLFSVEKFHLGVSVPVSLPIGLSTAYLGHGGFTANPRVAMEYAGRMRGLASVGVVVRDPRRLLDLTVGTAFTYGLAGEVPFSIGTQKLDLVAALQGEVGFLSAGWQQAPMELQLGVRWHTPISGLAVALGGGPGLTHGYGTPTYRALASVGFTPVEEVKPLPLPPPVLKLEPLVARTDEAQVQRGESVVIAVLDNDSGAERGQLHVAEVLQGTSGTVAVLADGTVSYAPATAFVGDDEFGYTLRDARGRTSFARVKVSVLAPPDADGDSVPDSVDRCPNEKGPASNDGCPVVEPVKVDAMVEIKADRLVILEKVYFATKQDVILERSFEVLREVGHVMKTHPELRKIRIEGHTDNQGGEAANQNLSQRRAKSVLRFLTQQGIEAARLETRGFGQSRPIAPNLNEAGRGKNRRVEFIVVDHGEAPAPLP